MEWICWITHEEEEGLVEGGWKLIVNELMKSCYVRTISTFAFRAKYDNPVILNGKTTRKKTFNRISGLQLLFLITD